MAHFCTTTRGSRTTTQIGHKTTGLTSHVNGWNLGCTATLSYNAEDDRDELHIVVTDANRLQTTLGTFINHPDSGLVRID